MSKKRILVIEDDRSLSEVLAYNLRQEKYDAVVALDGMDGLRQAQLKAPDLIILDLMLPQMDGLEVLSQTTFRSCDQQYTDSHADCQIRGDRSGCRFYTRSR